MNKEDPPPQDHTPLLALLPPLQPAGDSNISYIVLSKTLSIPAVIPEEATTTSG